MRFVGFVLAGGIATVVNYTLFAVLVQLGIHYLAASAIGYVSGVVVSFAINRRYVFRSDGGLRYQFSRYVAAYGVALAAQLTLLEGLVRSGITPLIANGIALVAVVIANYFLVARLVFPDESRTSNRVRQRNRSCRQI